MILLDSTIAIKKNVYIFIVYLQYFDQFVKYKSECDYNNKVLPLRDDLSTGCY